MIILMSIMIILSCSAGAACCLLVDLLSTEAFFSPSKVSQQSNLLSLSCNKSIAIAALRD
jgi:hypothetical protein